jgi:outer membrane protein OmpA-like peptidoglycan-associated protein
MFSFGVQANENFSWVDDLDDMTLFQKALRKIDEKGVHIKMRVRFNYASSQVADNSKQILRAFGEKMQHMEQELNSKFMVLVNGHTDSDGSKKNNEKLSARRAISVANFLIDNYDFNISDFYIKYHGENKPVDTNSTAKGRRNNRRVEFMLLNEKIVTVKLNTDYIASVNTKSVKHLKSKINSSSYSPASFISSLSFKKRTAVNMRLSRRWHGAIPLLEMNKRDKYIRVR